MIKKITLTLALIAFYFTLLPTYALAATTHHYVCGDISVSGGSCSSDSWTTTGAIYAYDHTPTLNLGSSKTWYVSYTGSGTATGRFMCGEYDPARAVTNNTGTNTAITCLSPSGNTVGFYADDDSHGGTFTYSNLCITDTSGDCEGGGGGGGGTATTTQVATSTIEVLSTLGFNAIILFLISLVISLWMWKLFMQ